MLRHVKSRSHSSLRTGLQSPIHNYCQYVLRGLSEKLRQSHHENNYTGAVKRLNAIQQQLGRLPKDAPPYQMGSLEREELIAMNSMLLHEFYFGNLGGDGKVMRHTVAALFNAANPDVNPVPAFNTPAEVIDAFQAAFDTRDYSTTKDLFATSNEADCWLT